MIIIIIIIIIIMIAIVIIIIIIIIIISSKPKLVESPMSWKKLISLFLRQTESYVINMNIKLLICYGTSCAWTF